MKVPLECIIEICNTTQRQKRTRKQPDYLVCTNVNTPPSKKKASMPEIVTPISSINTMSSENEEEQGSTASRSLASLFSKYTSRQSKTTNARKPQSSNDSELSSLSSSTTKSDTSNNTIRNKPSPSTSVLSTSTSKRTKKTTPSATFSVCKTDLEIPIHAFVPKNVENFLKFLFKGRIEVIKRPCHVNMQDLDETIQLNNDNYQLLVTKFHHLKGGKRGHKEQEQNFYKAYYIAASSPESLKSEMEKLGDFNLMPDFKIASRLELMLTPATKQFNEKLNGVIKMDVCNFETVDENQNVGMFECATFGHYHK